MTKAKKSVPEKLKKILIVPDAHHPFADDLAWDTLIRAAKHLQPDICVVLGDFVDLESCSMHAPTQGRPSLKYEMEVGYQALKELTEVLPKTCAKHFLEGNHEYRLQRKLMQVAPEIESTLRVPALLRLDELKWSFTPYKQSRVIGKVAFTHDLGKSGATAAFNAAQTYGDNVCIGHCLPLDYEVLDRASGSWVPLGTMTTGGQVLGYKDGAATWVDVTDVVRYAAGDTMVECTHPSMPAVMTTLHNVQLSDGRCLPLPDAMDIDANLLVDSALPEAGGDAELFTDDQLRAIVAFCADGSWDRTWARFHLRKERKIERLKMIFGDQISEHKQAGGTTKMNVVSGGWLGFLRANCANKTLPAGILLGLNARQREVVLQELPLWDGSILRGNARQFSSYKKEEIDLVQALLALSGRRSGGRRTCTGVTWMDKPGQHNRTKGNLPISFYCKLVRSPVSEVGCITTSTGNFFCRTPQGRVYVSGNTHTLSIRYGGGVNGHPHVGLSCGWLGDLEAISYMHVDKARSNWQHGFGLGYMQTNGIVHLAPVPIIDGHCVVEGVMI